MKQLTWLLFVVYIIQADMVISMRGSAPIISASTSSHVGPGRFLTGCDSRSASLVSCSAGG